MGLDQTYILRALGDLRKWIEVIRSLQDAMPTIEQDLIKQLALLHSVQLSIQIVLDVGAHVLASMRPGMVGDYGEIGPLLAKAGAIGSQLGQHMGEMAGFRNLLVHRYAELDVRRAVQAITGGLADFEEFDRCMVRFLESTRE